MNFSRLQQEITNQGGVSVVAASTGFKESTLNGYLQKKVTPRWITLIGLAGLMGLPTHTFI